jgi:hypothetical protein
MAKTPFIRPLQVQGGTFYTFSSSAEDLAFTFNNSTNKFTFSKFALLNIPNFDNSSSSTNYVRLNGPDGAFLDWANNTQKIITGNSNIDFSQSFQSYCLNLESTITGLPNKFGDYDPTKKQNISERIFFKWLKEIGAVRFRAANSTEVATTLDQNSIITDSNGLPQTQKRYVEGDATPGTTGAYGMTGPVYNRVVQYVGSLDIVNSVTNNSNSYSEVYVYVPTAAGNTPTVLFKNIVDTNYPPADQWTNSPNNPLNDEYLFGRNYTETNPSGLTSLAIYDADVLGSPTASYIDTGSSPATSVAGNWYSPRADANTYFTDSLFTDPSNYILTKTANSNSLTYIRSKLDSIGIDFDPSSYKAIADLQISTLDEYNSVPDAENFEFNAALIYYDVYDPATPSDRATNLYGILFLDEVNSSSGDIFIPRTQKKRPSAVTGLNGNSFGFKINLKFDSDIDQTGVEQAINDYSPFGLSMFMDAMNVLQDSSSTLNKSASQFIDLSSRVTNLENIALTTETSVNFNARISGIEESLAANQALFNNTQSILNLINQNYDLTRSILNNETSVEVSYNLNTINQGLGIGVDRSVENLVTINNTTQGFNIGQNKGYNILTQTGQNVIELLNFSNYFKHINNGIDINLTGDMTIRIDDTNVKWKNGQRFRISFGDRVYPQSSIITIVTDSQGLYPLSSPSGGIYSTTIIVLDDTIFSEWGYKPVFDIVCIDDQNLIFQVDAIGKSLTDNQ